MKALAGICLCHRYTLQFLFLGIALVLASPLVARLIRRRGGDPD